MIRIFRELWNWLGWKHEKTVIVPCNHILLLANDRGVTVYQEGSHKIVVRGNQAVRSYAKRFDFESRIWINPDEKQQGWIPVIPKVFYTVLSEPKTALEYHTLDGKSTSVQVSLRLAIKDPQKLARQEDELQHTIIQITKGLIGEHLYSYTQPDFALNRTRIMNQVKVKLKVVLEEKGLDVVEMILINLARTEEDAQYPSKGNTDILLEARQISQKHRKEIIQLEQTYKKEKEEIKMLQSHKLAEARLKYQKELQVLQQEVEIQKSQFQQEMLSMAQERDIVRIKKMKQTFPELDINKYLTEIRRNKLLVDKLIESKIKDIKINVKA